MPICKTRLYKVLMSGMWLSGCVGAASDERAASENGQSQLVSSQPTTLSLRLDGEQLEMPASARLQLGVDGRIEFSASSRTADNIFTMRLAVSSDRERLQGASFEFEPGLEPVNALAIVRGQLPNATSLRSVVGSVQLATFGDETFRLGFDAVLSKDPRGGDETVHAEGTLTGVASLVCLSANAANEGGHIQSGNGSPQVIMGAPRSRPECQNLKRMLDVN
jgi:hypothetical protein